MSNITVLNSGEKFSHASVGTLSKPGGYTMTDAEITERENLL